MEIKTYQCDQCLPKRTLRLQDSNNWFKGYILDFGVIVVPINVTVVKLSSEQVGLPVVASAHLCGVECAQKWTIKQLTKKDDYDPTKGDQL